jgi:excisionase family DNA binding protein
MNPENEFLTIEELADLLKISTRTLHRIIKRRELPVIRIGRQLRFRRESVDEWLQSQTQERSEGQYTA